VYIGKAPTSFLSTTFWAEITILNKISGGIKMEKIFSPILIDSMKCTVKKSRK